MEQFRSCFVNRVQQSRNGEVWLAHVQRNQSVVATNRLDPCERAPKVHGMPVRCSADCELYDVVTTQTIDEFGGSSRRDNHAVIDDGQTIAQTLCFVHV